MTQARTVDASYLHLQRIGTGWQIYFPDGRIKTFDEQGMLEKIEDRHGNWVKVAYAATQWIVTDGYGSEVARTHYVNLLDKSSLYAADRPNFQSVVSSIDLAAFDNDPDDQNDERALFQFTYEDRRVPRGGGGFHDRDDPDSTKHKPATYCIAAPFLASLQLPDQTTYVPTYKHLNLVSEPEPPGCSPPAGATTFDPPDIDYGVIQSLVIPTGGKIEWVHGTYPMNLQDCLLGRGFASEYVGVRSRVVRDRSGGELARWTYTPDMLEPGGYASFYCGGQTWNVPNPAEQFTNDVEVWSGPVEDGGRKLRTRHYFSVFPKGGWVGPNGLSLNGFRKADYGLPFTQFGAIGSTAGGDLRLLSREVSDCTSSCTPLRRSYVLYEHDLPDYVHHNSRVMAGRIVEVSDTGCGGTACYTDTKRSEWDGFGHYKKSVTTSNVPGSRALTTFTNYTPNSSNWQLNLYTTSWVKQETPNATVAAKQITTFDGTTGAMTSVRTLKATGPNPDALPESPADLLTVWCRDGSTTAVQRGFVRSERHFGGDAGSIPTGDLCTTERTTGNYFIDHEYTFTGGSLTGTRSRYTGTTHFVADVTLDRNTGRTRIARDTAGVETLFEVDTSGRLISVRPHGRVATNYAFSPGSTPPSVVMTQECPSGAGASPCSSDMLTEGRYYFDDLGRLSQEVSQVGTSEWASVWSAYDSLGRKKTVSVPFGVASGDSGAKPTGIPVTSWKYDVLGRPILETRPDGGITEWIYQGSRETERRVAGEHRSTERYNGMGQLVSVRQRADATSGDIITSYAYDVGGRLSSVRMIAPDGVLQQRVFDYDGRGFLRWETQPESGMASYIYDARGHMTEKQQSAAASQFDLRSTYDAAERLVQLAARNPDEPAEFRVIKEFAFGTGNVPGNLRNGKLVSAARYNYPPSEFDDTFKIEDTYVYGDASGRKTGRTTTISRFQFDDWFVLKSIDMGVTYNALDLPQSIQYPHCLDCGAPNVAPDRSGMAYSYRRGRLKGIAGWVSDISYWPSGLRNELVHANGRTDRQVVEDIPRPSSISFKPTLIDRCIRPSFLSQPASTTVAQAGGSTTLSVVASGTEPFEYDWVRVSTGESVGTSQSITLTNVTADDSFYVFVKNPCGFEQSQTAKVTVGNCEDPTIGGIEKIRQPDGTWLLKPNPTARADRTFLWVRLSDSAQLGTTETITVPASGSTLTYRLTITDGCGSAFSDLTITPPPNITQTDLVATATGSTQITVTWPASFNVSHYVVERRSGAAWQQVAGEHPTHSFVDNAVVSNRTYAYRVYAVRSGEKSDYSNSDVATTRSFMQAVTGQAISAVPTNDMLAAVNSVRAAAGWPPVTWSNILAASDPIPATEVLVLDRHISAARWRMNEALSALGVPIREYTGKSLVGATIRAVDVNEVQQQAQ